MKGRRLLVLSVLAFAIACEDQKLPTAPAAPMGPRAPTDPSAIISDGAHCSTPGIVCNPDFFFLPPMVPLPLHNANFELGKFNNTLRPSLKITICELKPQYDVRGLPTAATECVGGEPVQKFNPGTVQLVNLPLRQNGWWTLFGLPPDGFYYVLWDTRQSSLSVNKFYRIKVLIAGPPDVTLGVADVDPMSSLSQWKYTLTGEVIQLVNGFFLPIPFRVENGGGPTLCGGATLCASATVTNHTVNGDPQVVPVQGNNGPIAGAVFPDGWLPAGPGLPTSVVVTISSVNTGVNDDEAGTQANPCHAGLKLEQFNGCFKFTTTPPLGGFGVNGHQFARGVTVVTCFVLHDTGKLREKYAQLWASGPNEPAHPLVSVGDNLVLTVESEHDCGSNFTTVITSNTGSSNAFTQLASAGWGKLKAGVGRILGVQTAYAVDLGLGGLTLDFSNVGPAINARMSLSELEPDISVETGETTLLIARVVGTQEHDSSFLFDTGIPEYPVTFAIGQPTWGSLRLPGSQADGAASVIATTISGVITPGSPGSGGGFAAANWTAPLNPGSYTVTAGSTVAFGTVTFNLTVRPRLGVVDQSNAPSFSNLGANINDCCRYVAQTFTAGLTGTLVGVNVNVASTSAYPLNVAIRTVAGGVPTSTILGERTLSTGGAPLSQLITFPQTITLTAGVQYAIVVSYPGAPPPEPIQVQGLWSGTTGDLYVGGALYASVDGTSWFASGPGQDLQFQTHMSVSSP